MTWKEILEKHKKGECCKCSYCCEPCYNELLNEERNKDLLEEEPEEPNIDYKECGDD
jgi:hypothetical protein